MKKLLLFFIYFIVLSIFTFLFSPKTYASVPYEASDVLGQVNKNGESVFTSFGYNSEVPEDNSFKNPWDIVVDSSHHMLFVSDAGNSRILVYNLTETNELVDHHADYVLGQSNFNGSDGRCYWSGTILNNRFCNSSTLALAIDNVQNRLFVSDSGNYRILVFDITSIQTDEEPINVLGQPDFTTVDNGAAGQNTVGSSIGIAFDEVNNRLFVSDQGNNRVLIFDTSSLTNGMNASFVLGQPDFTTTTSDTNAKGFNMPQSIAYDSTHEKLYVTDVSNKRVLVFNTNSLSNNMDASYVIGQNNFTSSDSGTTINRFAYPRGVTTYPESNLLFVSDASNYRVLVFDAASLSNNMNASFVLGQPDFTTQTSDVNSQGFNWPGGMRIDSTNDLLYVADTSNNRVLTFNIAEIVNNEDAVYVLGQTDGNDQPDFTRSEVNDSHRTTPNAIGFDYIVATAVDTVHHRLFTTEYSNNRVLVFNLDANGMPLDTTADYVLGQNDFESNSYSSPSSNTMSPNYGGLAYDAEHNRLFAADNNRVLVFDLSNGISSGMNASYVLGQADFETDASACTNPDVSANTLCYVIGLTYSDGQLFVAEAGNARVLIFDLTNGISNGMSASYVLGQPDFTSYSNGLSQNQFSYSINGLAYDNVRKLLFIGEWDNNRVLVFDLSNGITNGMDASYVLGQPDYETSTEVITQTSTPAVNFLSYDPNQQLLFVSSGRFRISVFDISSISTNQAAIGVIGQPDFESTGRRTNTWGLYNDDYASNMGWDIENRVLYVPDIENERVLIFSFAHLIDLTDSTVSIGESVNQTLGSGYQGTTTYILDSGSLPPGISFNTNTGILSGSYTTSGSYTFTISISDDNGNAGVYTDTKTYTVVVSGTQATTSSPKPDGQYSTTEAPVCNTPKPDGIPSLFQIDRAYTDATLHFTPTRDNTTYYLISYGTTSEAEGYSVQLDQPTDITGALSYPIHDLSPNSSYYFKVRNGNSCNPGTWSETKKDSNTYTSTLTDTKLTDANDQSKKDDKNSSNSNLNKKQKDVKTPNEEQNKQPQSFNQTEQQSHQTNTPWYQSLWGWVKEKLGL